MNYFDLGLYLFIGGISAYNLSEASINFFDLFMFGGSCFFLGQKVFSILIRNELEKLKNEIEKEMKNE